MSKIKKIRFVTFSLAKYGGIISHVEAKFQAFKELGHNVDIIVLDYIKTVPKTQYSNKLKKLESGDFQNSLDIKSQNGGYSKSEITGYWSNPYYGWLLPESNRISALNPDSVEIFKEAVKDVDLIIWSFIPTKTSEAKEFNWWHKYFELPKKTKQILSVHDGYYDLRNSWSNLLKNKIELLECVHITSLNACKVFDIPRVLSLDSRYITNDTFENLTFKKDREFDFVSAHIFKSMKRMEDLASAIPYVDSEEILVAGSGIELYYMTTENEEKQKPKYTVSLKTDPDSKKEDIGKSLWKRAEENGMTYLGIVENETVNDLLKNSKFAIDPSYCTHYAKYVNTHLNGFTIEAIINGCYPILRNYRKDIVENDFIFNRLNAIFIPYDSTPKEFGSYLNKALKMPEEEYLEGVYKNMELAMEILNPTTNMKKLLKVVFKGETKDILKGKSNDKINQDAEKIMFDFFKYKNLPNWMID
jgi:glycosyltransferase involved in cell wall biosynthesis